jgi:predicted dehydrogenase
MALNRVFARFGRRLRLGVIGGGPGSFIGEIHRTAARLDDNFEIVAGVLSADPNRSLLAGRSIGLPLDRAYSSSVEMFAREGERADGMEVVAIMTPNDGHFGHCQQALERRLDVLCDKPLTTRLTDALDLVRQVHEAGVVFCNTFNYSAFPMVRQARAMVRNGAIGEIRMAHVEYVQGHNAALSPGERGLGPSNWHFDKDRTGPSLILADIGSHAHHLVRFVTGLDMTSVCAQVCATVPGRQSDDYGGALFRLSNGAPGTMWVTQAAAGAVHGLHIRVVGSNASLEWFEEQPNLLHVSRLGAPPFVLERGGPGLLPEAERAQRTGIGHPEGYIEAFAVLYADVAEVIVARRIGQPVDPLALDFPTVEDGARTMKFIDACLQSVQTRQWIECGLDL